MNKDFNTIETIRTTKQETSKCAAYISACDLFEQQASEYINNESFCCRKSIEEVSLAYNRAKHATCEYTTYVAANACEIWLKQVWNLAD